MIMNTKLILFSSFCFIASALSAQSFKVVPLKKNGRPEFMGANKQYFFFDAYGNNLLAVNRSNVQDKKMIKFDSIGYFSSTNTVFNNTEIIHVKPIFKTVLKNDGSKSFKNNGFKVIICDIMTGKETKNVMVEQKDTSSKTFEYHINRTDKTISIFRKDSLIERFDYQLNKLQNTSTKYEQPYDNEFDPIDINVALLRDLLKDLKFKFDVKIDVTSEDKLMDSTSFSNYNIRYASVSDDNIKYFKKYYKYIAIYNKSNTDSFEIDFPSDKKILEIDFKLNNANELIFFGKCATISNDYYNYEMFSTIINSNMEVVSNLKFFDLTNINYAIGEFYPFRENAGLVYCKLKSPDYEFHLKDEKVRVNFYQKRYSNVYDIIYIVKIHDNGEIILNKLVSQIKNDKNLPGMLYRVVKVKNKLNILWYENEANMQNAVYDMKHRFLITELKQKNTYLASTTYDPMEDDFSDKKIVAKKSEIKDVLSMGDSGVYYDENDHSTYFFVVGVDKKRKVKNLYIFNYTN